MNLRCSICYNRAIQYTADSVCSNCLRQSRRILSGMAVAILALSLWGCADAGSVPDERDGGPPAATAGPASATAPQADDSPALIVGAIVQRARFYCPTIRFDAERSAAVEAEIRATLGDPEGNYEPDPRILPPGGFGDWNAELPAFWSETYADIARHIRTDQLHTVPTDPCPSAVWAAAIEAVNQGFRRVAAGETRLHWRGGYLQ